MGIEALSWAMETEEAASPAERVILMGIADAADTYGFAMKHLPELAKLACLEADAFGDVMMDLIVREVIAILPELGAAYGYLGAGDGYQWRLPDGLVAMVLTGWRDRDRLVSGAEHPLLGVVDLP